MSSKKQEISPHKQPLIDFLSCLLDYDMGTLFNILDVAHHNLIYESTEEQLIMSEFITVLFIAAKAEGILNNKKE